MELQPSSTPLNKNEVDVSEPEVGHNTCETQVDRNEILNSADRKACHQCRQMKKGFPAPCKNLRNGKPCVIKFCCSCLSNRYEEKTEEVQKLNDWICPKCRGICNCSCCMKKRGQQPTGRFVRTAKSSGFKPVSENLSLINSGDLQSTTVNNTFVFPKKEATLRKEHKSVDNSSSDKETDTNVRKNVVKSKTQKVAEFPLPPTTLVTKILDIEFPPEDVGKALQFLEFYRVFGQAIDVPHGDGEFILRELIDMKNLQCGQINIAVHFQIILLTSILRDSRPESPSLTTTAGNNSWLKALHDLITKSNLLLKELPLDWIKEDITGYCNLNSSIKLSLLNFICDEALCTKKFRSLIDEQNEKFVEEKKEEKSKVVAAKEKERSLKQKLLNEMAKDVIPNSSGASISPSEHDALISNLKSDVARAHTEILEAKGTISKRNSYSEAARIVPEFLDSSGQKFWKLKSHDGGYVLLQDLKINIEDGAAANEQWFVYGSKHKDDVDKYISSRTKRSKIRKVPLILSNESSESNS